MTPRPETHRKRARVLERITDTHAQRSVADADDLGAFSDPKVAIDRAVEWATKWIDGNAGERHVVSPVLTTILPPP
jgi:hypothetical protein